MGKPWKGLMGSGLLWDTLFWTGLYSGGAFSPSVGAFAVCAGRFACSCRT